MPDLSTASPAPAAPGWLAQCAGILVSPRRTMAAALARGRWAGMLAALSVVTMLCAGIFGATAVGQQAMRDTQVRGVESFGGTMTDAAYARLGAIDRYGAAIGAAEGLVGTPLGVLAIALVLFGVGRVLPGARASLTDLVVVVTFSGVILMVQQLIAYPLDYARQAIVTPLNLSDLIPVFDQGSFAGWLAGSINLFRLWWIGVLAIGLSLVYGRRAGRLALVLCGLYLLAGIILAAVQTATGGV